MKTETIQSLRELQLKMPAIIEQYGRDNNLTKLALANPIAALEKTGLTFTDEAKIEIETHVRFGKEGAVKYNELKEKIYTIAGSRIDLNNNNAIADNIINTTGDTTKSNKTAKEKQPVYSTANKLDRTELLNALLTKPAKINGYPEDKLAAFASYHPLIPLLITYRQMNIQNPAFAKPEDIPMIEEKLKKSPLTNVVFSLKRNNN